MTENEKVTELINPEEFRVPARNIHNHSDRCQFRAQPERISEGSALLATRLFPYRTMGDLYRHGFVRHLRYLHGLTEKLDKPISSVMSVLDACDDILREEEFKARLTVVIERLAKLVSEMVGKSAPDEAKRLILKIKRQIKQMPEGFWRDRCVKDIDERFGYLLGGMERASLLKLATGKEE